MAALVTLLRSSVCGLRNISEFCKLFRARPAPASTHLDPGLPSPGFTTSPACSHPPPNVAKVESDQNVKMAKCVPPYTLQFCISADCNITDMICYVVVTQLSIQQLLQVQSTAVDCIYNLDIEHNFRMIDRYLQAPVNIFTCVHKIIS